ncbi:MAG: hypothetical protein M3Z04_07835 [Chloroflexota bacterium]|nr:hypothetical protein [Chloroflexota bacterium]
MYALLQQVQTALEERLEEGDRRRRQARLDGLAGNRHAMIHRHLGEDLVAGRGVLDKASHQNQHDQRAGQLRLALNQAGLTRAPRGLGGK